MEYWEYKADDGLILQTDPCRPYKNRSQSTKPSIPAFIIPCSIFDIRFFKVSMDCLSIIQRSYVK
ncbi:hypothetical protein D1AOALGA4SA_6372 [Olavius algarvensis Delta 1 endosymbiont]|nr:hypothetical protein D1AOALGA4SA_6372 [Olavius algarvensis Delta 1 endosymbiont]